MSANRNVVEAVLGNHLQAFFRKSVDGVVEDYAEDSILIVPDGALHGRADIRKFFSAFIGGLPAGFLDSFKIRRQEITGDVGYIVWEAAPWVRLGTDTLLVRDGKIRMQTFAAYPAVDWARR